MERSTRSDVRRALVDRGTPEDEAEAWCAAWESEAARQDIGQNTLYFWDAGRGWIDAQRSFPRRGRLERAG